MNRRYITLGSAYLLLMSLATGARAGMFDFMKIYLFSEVGGVVTMDGKPVAGVEVERIAKADKKYIDKTVTDADGRFHFKAITEYSPYKKFIKQAVILENIYFHYKGKKYIGWDHLKTDYDKNGETDNYASITHLKCDLSKKPTDKAQEVSGTVYGVCDWK